MADQGVLYIVSTPIGNLRDMTLNAIDVLQRVSMICAEDTRHSGILLKHYQINTPLLSLHEHNEQKQGARVLKELAQGHDVALISDAGTPLIHDPGYLLVHEARAQGVFVRAIPGACAIVAALSVAGLPCNRFVFEGFLSAKPANRRSQLTQLADETRTMVFYEAPHRLLACLRDMATIFGQDHHGVLLKELTKKYEHYEAGGLALLVEQLSKTTIKGEYVVLLSGCVAQTQTQKRTQEVTQLLMLLLPQMSLSQAVQITATHTGAAKNAVYRIAQTLNQVQGDDHLPCLDKDHPR